MNRMLHARLSMLGFTMTLPVVAVTWPGTVPGEASSVMLTLLAAAALSMTALILRSRRNAVESERIEPALQPAGIPGTAAVSVRPAMDRRLRP
jgi:hypothetical protein